MPTAAQRPQTSAGMIAVEVRGELDHAVQCHAVAAIGAVLAEHRLAASARIRLAGSACGHGPALVQVNLRAGDTRARVQVAGRPAVAAITAGAARLDRQIRSVVRDVGARPWPDPQRRALAVPGHGDIVRIKSVRLLTGTPGEAVAVMDAMDYDAHLFTDAETGEDAIVYRAGPTGLRLARQRRMHPSPTLGTDTLVVNSRPVPTLTAAEAGRRLAEGWLPYLFFTDVDTGRGSLVYRRYDGDLGLIRPVAAAGAGVSDERVGRPG